MSPDVVAEYLGGSKRSGVGSGVGAGAVAPAVGVRAAPPAAAADKRRRGKWLTSVAVAEWGDTVEAAAAVGVGRRRPPEASAQLAVVMGDTVMGRSSSETGSTSLRGGKRGGKAAPAGYMRLVEEADRRRRAEGAAAAGGGGGGGNSGDGKRSLATWHAPDSYAFGVVLWQVLTLRQPWAGVAVMHEIWIRVQRGERPPVTAADAAGASALSAAVTGGRSPRCTRSQIW